MYECVYVSCFNENVAQWSEEGGEASSSTDLLLIKHTERDGMQRKTGGWEWERRKEEIG